MSLTHLAAFGALVLAGGPARAAEPEGRVQLSLPSCELPNLSPQQLRAAVAIELGSSGLALVPDGVFSDAGDIEASVATTCAEDGVLELSATWGARNGSRTLTLAELPAPARPRAVALALAELLAAIRPEDETAPIEVELAEEPAPVSDAAANAAGASTKTAAQPAAKRTAAARRSELAPGSADSGRELDAMYPTPRQTRSAFTLKGEVRSFALEPVVLGLRAGYEFERFAVGVTVLRGSATGTYGSVSATILNGYFEWRIHEFGRPTSPWFTFGPRLGLGAVMLAPTPSPTALALGSTDVYADIAQFCEFWAALPPFRFGAQLELGYALGAIAYETGNRLANYGGPFGSVLLEATWLL